MTEQKKKISQLVDYLKSRNFFKKKCELAIVSYPNPYFLKQFKVKEKISYSNMLPKFERDIKGNEGEFLYTTAGKKGKNLIFLNGRFNAFSGYNMREIAHPIYVLKELGVKTIILVDEAGYLNPRFEKGGVSLIYDHINLMGDNPLIGENDQSLGPRFPDMSNAYDSYLYNKTEELFVKEEFKFYPSVYLGITGPETETEAECRFYRDIGADILGYGLVPENIAAIHSGMRTIAFGMLSRELVADRLEEISQEEQTKNRVKAEKAFAPILKKLIDQL